MHKLLIAVLAMAAIFGVMTTTADAGFSAGTTSGSSITVGGDGGSANVVDLAGDIVAVYTSAAGNDTVFKTTQGPNAAATVVAVFGDTAIPVGAVSTTLLPGGIASYTMNVTNWSNQSDTIKVGTDTTSVTGLGKDSITIRVNGTIVFQNNTLYPAVALTALAPGASTNVTVTMEHDTPGVLGVTSAIIKARANNGLGGDAGGYIGNNGVNFAGLGDDSVAYTVNVKEVKILLAVEQTLMTLPASYAGSIGDTIPGATVRYTIRYDNDGNDTGVGFAINTKIPANTALGFGAADSVTATAHTGAVPTITITNDTGVVVGDSDPSASRIKWTFSLGVGANNGDANGTVDAAAPDVDAGYVQFKVYIK